MCKDHWMNGENRVLVIDELVAFEKLPVEVQDCRKNYRSFKRNLQSKPQIRIIKNREIATCNQLDLESLGFWLIMPNNLPGHCLKTFSSNEWEERILCNNIPFSPTWPRTSVGGSMNVLAGRRKKWNRKSRFKIPQVVHKNVCPDSEACRKIGHVQ